MKLKYKLFITLISTSGLILLLVIGVIHFSIRKNFIEFLNDVEFNKQTEMINQLTQSYTRHSGWKEYRGNPRAWHRLLRKSGPVAGRLKDRGPAHFTDKPLGPPPLPNDPAFLHRRLCLFDADKTWLAGESRQEGQFNFYPIEISGQTIGYLGLEDMDDMRQPLELDFLKKQTQAFYIIGGGILALSLLMSYLISRQLLRPVNALSQGTRDMRRFNFDTRVDVNSNDELGALAEDFNLMAATLKQYESMRKNWISDISHELRTPVAVIRSKIEALQDGIRELTPELIDSLHRDILGLGKLINDLHQISLMDSKNLAVKLKPISLEAILSQTLDAFSIRFEQEGMEIRVERDPHTIPDIQGDAALLKRVFANIMENTLKYTDSPGILKLACRVRQGNVLIEIEDSAPGVPPDCLDAIFERLYRIERSRSRALGGSGLGLSLSREIISLHQGTIKASPSTLGGLKIEIQLPVTTKNKN